MRVCSRVYINHYITALTKETKQKKFLYVSVSFSDSVKLKLFTLKLFIHIIHFFLLDNVCYKVSSLLVYVRVYCDGATLVYINMRA